MSPRSEKDMKVAFYTTVDKYCGVARPSEELINCLKKDIEVDIFQMIKNPGLFHRYDFKEKFRSYDLVHLQHMHSFWGNSYLESSLKFYLLRRHIEKPLVITMHAIWPSLETGTLRNKIVDNIGVYNLINRIIFRNASIIVHNDVHREILLERGFNPGKVYSIPFGIHKPIQVNNSDKEQFIKKFNLSGRRIIVILGSINAYKNYELALHALSKVKAESMILFAGGFREDYDQRDYKDKFNALIDKLGLRDRIVITGNVTEDEMRLALSTSEICVVPYSSDISLSYSMNFSIASNKPAIVSDVATSRRTQEKYGCFELFKKNDSTDLAGKVEYLLNNNQRKQQLVDNTKKYQESWGWEEAAKATKKVYENALKSR